MYYTDSSALVKLIVPEPETEAMRQWWAGVGGEVATSALARTELLRVALRRDPERAAAVRSLLSSCLEIELDRGVFDRAGSMQPAILRSLDAIHLACAERMGTSLRGVVTYDRRLAEAAEVLGMTVISPV